MTMMESWMECIDRKVSEPEPRGERVATYFETYLNTHRGITLGEIAFSIGADKRDLQRLVRDRSCGWRLEDKLAAYFGDDFVEAVFRPVVGDGPSIREKELDRERARIAARRARLERDRAQARSFRFDVPAVHRLDNEQDG